MSPVFSSLGEQLQAVMRACSHGRDRFIDQRLFDIQKRASPAAGGNEAIPSAGGFLVAAEFVPQLIERMYLTGEILSRCRDLPITQLNSNSLKFAQFNESSRANGSRLGGVSASWIDEAAALPAPSRPTFQLSEMRPKKLVALIYTTDELAQDASSLEQFTTMAFGHEMSFVLEESIINSGGLDQPVGILNSPALIKIAKESGQAPATVDPLNCQGRSNTRPPGRRESRPVHG